MKHGRVVGCEEAKELRRGKGEGDRRLLSCTKYTEHKDDKREDDGG